MQTIEFNKTALCKFLSDNECVSIPMLQVELNLSYVNAKKVMTEIIARSWAQEEADGVYYQIRHDNMIKLTLSRRKVDRLYNVLTADCLRAIKFLSVHTYGDYYDLLDAVQGDEDTKAAIEILLKEKLSVKSTVDTIYACQKKQLICLRKDRGEKREIPLEIAAIPIHRCI